MYRSMKILTITLWFVVLALAATLLAAKLAGRSVPQPDAAELSVLFDAPHFSLIDQNNRPVTDQTLRGQVWIADFIFTNCAGPCPAMSSRMAALQRQLPHVIVVSFSVDPERDTPQVLREYAKKFQTDDSRWHLLTGDRNAIFAVAAGLKLVAQDADPDNALLHSTKFLMIDRDGRVRGIYDSGESDEMQRLIRDAGALVNTTSRDHR